MTLTLLYDFALFSIDCKTAKQRFFLAKKIKMALQCFVLNFLFHNSIKCRSINYWVMEKYKLRVLLEETQIFYQAVVSSNECLSLPF